MDDPFKQGEKLRQCCVHANFTQEFVAAQLGVPKSTYCEYEKGMRPVPVQLVLKAAMLFKQPTAVFFIEAALALHAAGNEAAPSTPTDPLTSEMLLSLMRASEERERKLLEFMQEQAALLEKRATTLSKFTRKEKW